MKFVDVVAMTAFSPLNPASVADEKREISELHLHIDNHITISCRPFLDELNEQITCTLILKRLPKVILNRPCIFFIWLHVRGLSCPSFGHSIRVNSIVPIFVTSGYVYSDWLK